MAVRPGSVPLRFWHLMASVPDFLDYSSVLYVGGNRTRLQLVHELWWAGSDIDIVEIWAAYVRELRRGQKKRAYFSRIMQGDVRALAEAIGDRKYELVVWWHGPEHVDRHDLPRALACLEAAATHLCVVGCPHGRCGQGVTKDGNVYQRHRTHWLPTDFEEIGWKAATLRPDPGMDSHLIGWKRIAR